MIRLRKAGAGLMSLLLLGGSLLALVRHQDIYDWWRLRSYDPPARITQLAESTTMNDFGRRLFYVYHPALDDKAAFTAHCRGHEQSIVLGCYISGHAIYIFDVQDARLQGVHEVTAAHEMLHAAYDRLSAKEKSRIDTLLQNHFANLKNERLAKTIESYRAKDASVVPNELHSIIGTEVRNLPLELEDYYKKYFEDRTRIVAFSEQYEQAFTERENKVEVYDNQLTDIKQRIETAENQLNDLSGDLTSERTRLDQLLTSGQTENYNAAVPGFNARVRQYNNLVASTKQLIEQYNQIVQERNAIALEEQELVKALDSRVTTQPEQ